MRERQADEPPAAGVAGEAGVAGGGDGQRHGEASRDAATRSVALQRVLSAEPTDPRAAAPPQREQQGHRRRHGEGRVRAGETQARADRHGVQGHERREVAGHRAPRPGRAVRHRHPRLYRLHGAGRRTVQGAGPLRRRLQLRHRRHGGSHYLQPRLRRPHEPRSLPHGHDPGEAVAAHVVHLLRVPVPGRGPGLRHPHGHHAVQVLRDQPQGSDAQPVLQRAQPPAVHEPGLLVRVRLLRSPQPAGLRRVGQEEPGQARLRVPALRPGRLRHRLRRSPVLRLQHEPGPLLRSRPGLELLGQPLAVLGGSSPRQHRGRHVLPTGVP